jgi:alkanesulfonate monooxygenase
MGVNFVGWLESHEASEVKLREGPVINPDYIQSMLKKYENSGFDKVLVPFFSNAADSIAIAGYCAALTQRLGFLIAHRPGFTAPTVAARQLATLDQLSNGRISLHVIAGAEDAEMQRDGDHSVKDQRYARADDYLDIVKSTWRSEQPFDHEGSFYKIKGASSLVKPSPKGIPIWFGGASDEAIRVGTKHADLYALWGETYDDVKDLVSRIRGEAAEQGREMTFSLSFRLVLEDTVEKAWARAESILERGRALMEKMGTAPTMLPANKGSQRLLDVVARGSRLEDCIWTDMAKLVGGRYNTVALVGTPDQVANVLLKFHRLGIGTFLTRGFEPWRDVEDYSRTLIPRLKELVAREPEMDLVS